MYCNQLERRGMETLLGQQPLDQAVKKLYDKCYIPGPRYNEISEPKKIHSTEETKYM